MALGQGPPPARETNLGAGTEPEIEAQAPVTASAVMLKITYCPSLPSLQNAPPT